MLTLLLLTAWTAHATSSQPPSVGSMSLESHSFHAPLTFDTGLAAWYLTGTSVSRTQGVILNPSIEDKFGFFFHNAPITTTNFEIVADIDVIGLAKPSNADQAFGMWYVATNASAEVDAIVRRRVVQAKRDDPKDWNTISTEEGRTLLSMSPRFRGVAVFFSYARGLPTVTLAVNDGTRSVAIANERLSRTFDFRNKDRPVQVKLRMHADRVDLKIKLRGDAWTDVASAVLPSNLFPSSGGYLGFTSNTGKGDSADQVVIRQIQSFTFEAPKGLAGSAADLLMAAEGQDTLATMKKATVVLLDHLQEVRPSDDKIINQVMELQKKVRTIETTLEQLRLEIKYTFKTDSGNRKSDLDSLTRELHGLKQALSEDGGQIEALASKIQGGRSNIAETVKRTNSELEEAIRSTHTTAGIVIIAFIALTCLVGGALYRRMTSYEKKHFL